MSATDGSHTPRKCKSALRDMDALRCRSRSRLSQTQPFASVRRFSSARGSPLWSLANHGKEISNFCASGCRNWLPRGIQHFSTLINRETSHGIYIYKYIVRLSTPIYHHKSFPSVSSHFIIPVLLIPRCFFDHGCHVEFSGYNAVRRSLPK